MIDKTDFYTAMADVLNKLDKPLETISDFEKKEYVLVQLAARTPDPVASVLLDIINDLKSI